MNCERFTIFVDRRNYSTPSVDVPSGTEHDPRITSSQTNRVDPDSLPESDAAIQPDDSLGPDTLQTYSRYQ